MTEPEARNSIVDLKKFLSTPDRPVSTAEFTEFWKDCTEEEKIQFKAEILPESE